MTSPVVLESAAVRVTLHPERLTIVNLHNQLSGERYEIDGDKFEVVTDRFTFALDDTTLEARDVRNGCVVARYHGSDGTVEVRYSLGATDHFVRKHLTFTPAQDCGVYKVVLSSFRFESRQLLMLVRYAYQQNLTVFGRTPAGGFFTGMELAFAEETVDGNTVTLSYRPNLKRRAGQSLPTEAAYLGIYRREKDEHPIPGEFTRGQFHHLPGASESQAMQAMVQRVLGPPRHGPTAVFSPSCCGGLNVFKKESDLSKDDAWAKTYRQIIDFAAECGFQWMQDILPWGGETNRLSRLGDELDFTPEPWRARILDQARTHGMTPIMWSTFNNTQPWSPDGQAMRPDHPEWLVDPIQNASAHLDVPRCDSRIWELRPNCLGSDEYLGWLTRFFVQAMREGGYQGFSIDGDFWGTGGWYTSAACPMHCRSDRHDHLPGDTQYVSQLALARLLATVRSRHPTAFLWLMRPMMDLGIWTARNGDALFTIDEMAGITNLTGVAGQAPNVTYGDKLRIWSRLRRERHFCPRYLDQVQLFATMGGGGDAGPWLSEHLDYVMLSALSASPNQCFFCGPVDHIPPSDRAVIRRWLDWARLHAELMMVHKDLPAWPGKDCVDGTAHCRGSHGIVLLFNPNGQSLRAELPLDERIGLTGLGPVGIRQEYPEQAPEGGSLHHNAPYGQTVSWPVAGQTAVVLRLEADPVASRAENDD